VIGWLLMQIVMQVFLFLEIPNWAIRARDNADSDWFSHCPGNRVDVVAVYINSIG
jgi:hypothetical protein